MTQCEIGSFSTPPRGASCSFDGEGNVNTCVWLTVHLLYAGLRTEILLTDNPLRPSAVGAFPTCFVSLMLSVDYLDETVVPRGVPFEYVLAICGQLTNKTRVRAV